MQFDDYINAIGMTADVAEMEKTTTLAGAREILWPPTFIILAENQNTSFEKSITNTNSIYSWIVGLFYYHKLIPTRATGISLYHLRKSRAWFTCLNYENWHKYTHKLLSHIFDSNPDCLCISFQTNFANYELPKQVICITAQNLLNNAVYSKFKTLPYLPLTIAPAEILELYIYELSLIKSLRPSMIFTDGAAIANGKDNCKSGWAVCGITTYGTYLPEIYATRHIRENYCLVYYTGKPPDVQSNNIAELHGLLEGIKLSKYLQNADIYSDSQYAIKSITIWGTKQMTTTGKARKNLTLITDCIDAYEDHREYISSINHIRSHTKFPHNGTENEKIIWLCNAIVDKLATSAY